GINQRKPDRERWGNEFFVEVVGSATAGHRTFRADGSQAESTESAREAGGTGGHPARCASVEGRACCAAAADSAVAANAGPARPGGSSGATAGAAGAICGERRAAEGVRGGRSRCPPGGGA